MRPDTDLAVILPCYNPGPELVWTLDSLRAQTVPFRLYVTDDGSARKPDYRALLEGFDHELIELERNVGPCLVRNPSIRRALDAGFDWVALIDCGDWAHPERLERQRAFLRDHAPVGAVGCDVEVLTNDFTHAYDFTPPRDTVAIRIHQHYAMAFKHPAVMFRADVLRDVGLYTGDYDAAEDYELLRRIAEVTDLANLPEQLLKTVEYDMGVSKTRRRAQLVSRLRIQWRYRDATSIHTWLGMARTLATLALPARVASLIRPFFHHRPDAKQDQASDMRPAGDAADRQPVPAGDLDQAGQLRS